METEVHRRVQMARDGTNATVICKMPSGWAVLGDTQFLCGYSLLLSDPIVETIHDLTDEDQAMFMRDMVTIGKSILENVPGVVRINYEILGNSDHALHAHIVPRTAWEPFWGYSWHTYPESLLGKYPINESHNKLIKVLREAIERKLI